MRKLDICIKHIDYESRGVQRIAYRILVDTLSEGGIDLESYGMEVENLDSGEAEQIPGITISKEKIENIVDLIATNTVTPGFLKETLDALLGVIV